MKALKCVVLVMALFASISQTHASVIVYNAGFTYNDFLSITHLNIVGNAEQNGDQMRLTPSVSAQVGGMWYDNQQEVKYGFDTTFQFRITDPNPYSGGDGFAFIIQNDSSTALGEGGGGMGYSGLQQRIAIEFDTYLNPAGYPGEHLDPSDNHVSIQILGVVPNESDHANSIGCTSDIPRMADGNIHTVNIKYDSGVMNITLDNSAMPNLQVAMNLEDYIILNDNSAWVGLAASTGSAWEAHDILNWSFEVPEPCTITLLALGGGIYAIRRKS